MDSTSLAATLGLSLASGTAVHAAASFDYAGLATVITALSTLIASVGAIYLGNRKRGSDATEKALEMLMELQAKQLKPPHDPKLDSPPS